MSHSHRYLVAATIAVLSSLAAPSAWAGLCAGCGRNAATVGDGTVFDELNVKGARRGNGPRIRGALLNGDPVELRVEGDTLFALTKGKRLKDVALVGLRVTLEAKDGRSYDLTLDAVHDEMKFWAEPHDPLFTYDFVVHETGRVVDPTSTDVKTHLCTAKHIESTAILPAAQDLKFTAIVFQGDRFNEDHSVSNQPEGWFNLACFGTAAAKMHLLRHTRAGTPRDGSRTTTRAQRTAMLRAITADYCGDGRAWTGDGTPLWWTDKNLTFPLEIQPEFSSLAAGAFSKQIEAVWGPKGGLLCLNEPRRTPAPGNPSPNCTSPMVERKIVTSGAKACHLGRPLPRCESFLWSGKPANPWVDSPLAPNPGNPKATLPGAYLITVNVPPTLRTQDAGDYCEKEPISWPR